MKKQVILLILLIAVSSFKFFDFNPYKKHVTKFGDVFWHKNTSDSEEVIYEGENSHDGSEEKAAFDTILDVTQNPQRQK